MLVIKRGRNGVGEDYENTIHYYLGGLSGNEDKTPSPYELRLPETSEPFGLVSLSDKRNGLLSVITEGDEVKFELRDLKKHNSQNCKFESQNLCMYVVNIKTPLDSSWIRMPVQILPSSEPNLSKTSIIFLSRVFCKNGKNEINCHNINDIENFPQTIHIEFIYHRLVSNNDSSYELKRLGGDLCNIDLRKQREEYKRPAKESYEDGYLVTGIKGFLPNSKQKSDHEFLPIVYKDFANRWASSQVIPGRIFSRNPSSDQDLLDVVVIFKGYPGFSLLLKGTKNSKAEYGLTAFSPSYVTCNS